MRRSAAATNRSGPDTAKLVRRTKAEVPTPIPTRMRTKAEKGLPINHQQQKFVAEYLKDYDIEAAAKRAGYKGSRASVMDVFSKLSVFVREAQAAKAREIGKRTFTSQERVLNELAAEAHYSEFDFVVIEQVLDPLDKKQQKTMTIRRQKRLEELSPEQQMIVTNIRFEANGAASYSLPSRMKAREMIGRHLGMFNDKLIMEHRHRQLSGRPDLSNVPDTLLDRMEAELLKHMGPKGLRLVGEYLGRDENEFDATQSK